MADEEQRMTDPLTDKNTERDEYEVDVLELFYRLAEKWKLIVAGALIGALIMAVYSFFLAAPVYEATSKLYVLNSSDSAINLSDLQIGAYLTADYQQVFEAWEVHELVMQNLELDYTYDQMKHMLKVSNPSNTRVLLLTVRNKDAELAAELANEYANVAKRYISETMETDEPKILSEALTPAAPVSPRKIRNVMTGFIFGFIGTCCLVGIQYLLDDKLKTVEDIRKYTDLPTLAVVPKNGNSPVR